MRVRATFFHRGGKYAAEDTVDVGELRLWQPGDGFIIAIVERQTVLGVRGVWSFLQQHIVVTENAEPGWSPEAGEFAGYCFLPDDVRSFALRED